MDLEADAMTAARPGATARVAEDRRGGYDGNKPPQAIEEDIARTRVRLSATIEALEHELRPERVIERSAEALRSSLEPGPGPFHEQVWAYAIPLALIATGLGWLFVLRRRGYQADMPSSVGASPANAVPVGQTPSVRPRYADLADPSEPVSLLDEKTAIR